MFRSSGSDRYESKGNIKGGCCCIPQYEDQISVLQQKLMQTHNKLIQQLDVCQEQELTIIELSKKIMRLETGQGSEDSVSFASSDNNADVSKDSNDSNKACFYQNKNCEFTLNNSNQLLMSNYNSPTFIENNRNELLKQDLEAMRQKLLQEVTQKTTLKEQLNQLKILHSQKTQEYKKQIKDLEHDHEFLLKEYEYIKINLEQGNLRKSNEKNFSSAQLVELNEKCIQFERCYKKELALNQELNQRISQLKILVSSQKDKIISLEDDLQKYSHCIKSTSTAADGLKDERDRQDMPGTIRISKNPGSLWEKDSNKSRNSATNRNTQNASDNEIFKKRNTVIEIKFSNEQAKSNKENIAESMSSVKSSAKDKNKNAKRQDYESTKQLIRKLEQAEMMTRQRRKTAMG